MEFSEPVNGVIEIWSEDTPLGELVAQESGKWFYNCELDEGILASAAELRQIADKLDELNHEPRMDLETGESVMLWTLDAGTIYMALCDNRLEDLCSIGSPLAEAMNRLWYAILVAKGKVVAKSEPAPVDNTGCA